MSRILVLMLVLLLVLSCAMPTFAVLYDYNDYITDIQVDGDNDICTVEIPFNGLWLVGEPDSTGAYVYTRYYGNDVYVPMDSTKSYRIAVSPFNNHAIFNLSVGSVLSPDAIDLEDLPAGSTLETFVNVGVGNGGVSVGSYQSFFYYVNKGVDGYTLAVPSSNLVTSGSVDDNNLNIYLTTSPFVLEKKGDAFLYSYWLSDLDVQYTGDTLLACKTVLTFSISSVYREYAQNGKHTALLKAIDGQLKANGQTLKDVLEQQQQIHDSLDDIINSEVTGEAPDGSDTVTDYESAEQELMDKVSGGSSQFDDITVSASDRIHLYSQAFLAFGYIFNLFADIPFLQGLLYVSLTLGSFAFLLGIGSAAARYYNYHHTAAGKRRGG